MPGVGALLQAMRPEDSSAVTRNSAARVEAATPRNNARNRRKERLGLGMIRLEFWAGPRRHGTFPWSGAEACCHFVTMVPMADNPGKPSFCRSAKGSHAMAARGAKRGTILTG